MIKALGSQNGRPVLLLGLSFMNLDLLREDKPIVIHKEDFGPHESVPFDIVIFAGETEQSMADALKPSFTDDVKVTGSVERQRRN
jgi:hypothetical protein